MLVSSKSQVPEWINQKTVKVITHDQFIPKHHLPTFQSQSIEMYLDRIPGLSEHFIYTNDDIFFTGILSPIDFFEDGKLKGIIATRRIKRYPIPLWQISILNNNALIYNKPLKNIIMNETYLTTIQHGSRPYIKSIMSEVNTKFADQIEASVTKFRAEQNFNVYLYDLYADKNGFLKKSTLKNHYADSKASFKTVKNKILDSSAKMICINDTHEEYERDREYKIFVLFESIHQEKSKYEL